MTFKMKGESYLLVAETMMKPTEEDKNKNIDECISTDILENTLREQMPGILDILLMDRTTSTPKTKKNIIWANENYIKHGNEAYAAIAQMRPELVTGQMGQIIKPRALKISKKLTNTEIMTRTPVSTRNILKILVELAPLHLCTPTPFARRLKVAMDINI